MSRAEILKLIIFIRTRCTKAASFKSQERQDRTKHSRIRALLSKLAMRAKKPFSPQNPQGLKKLRSDGQRESPVKHLARRCPPCAVCSSLHKVRDESPTYTLVDSQLILLVSLKDGHLSPASISYVLACSLSLSLSLSHHRHTAQTPVQRYRAGATQILCLSYALNEQLFACLSPFTRRRARSRLLSRAFFRRPARRRLWCIFTSAGGFLAARNDAMMN